MAVKYKFARQKRRNTAFRQKTECHNDNLHRDKSGFPSDGSEILAEIFEEIVGENEEQEKEYAGYLGQNLLQQGGTFIFCQFSAWEWL